MFCPSACRSSVMYMCNVVHPELLVALPQTDLRPTHTQLVYACEENMLSFSVVDPDALPLRRVSFADLHIPEVLIRSAFSSFARYDCACLFIGQPVSAVDAKISNTHTQTHTHTHTHSRAGSTLCKIHVSPWSLHTVHSGDDVLPPCLSNSTSQHRRYHLSQ